MDFLSAYFLKNIFLYDLKFDLYSRICRRLDMSKGRYSRWNKWRSGNGPRRLTSAPTFIQRYILSRFLLHALNNRARPSWWTYNINDTDDVCWTYVRKTVSMTIIFFSSRIFRLAQASCLDHRPADINRDFGSRWYYAGGDLITYLTDSGGSVKSDWPTSILDSFSCNALATFFLYTDPLWLGITAVNRLPSIIRGKTWNFHFIFRATDRLSLEPEAFLGLCISLRCW